MHHRDPTPAEVRGQAYLLAERALAGRNLHQQLATAIEDAYVAHITLTPPAIIARYAVEKLGFKTRPSFEVVA